MIDDLRSGDWVLVCAQVAGVPNGGRVLVSIDGAGVTAQASIAVSAIKDKTDAPVRAGDELDGGKVLAVHGDRAWVLKDDGSDETIDLAKAQERREREAKRAAKAADEVAPE